MSRIPLPAPADAPAASRPLLQQIDAAFGGSAPVMFRAVAHSPAALRSLWGSFGALSAGGVPPALAEQIAVAVANRNACHYCLAAHTALGRKAGVSAEDLAEAQAGRSRDPRTAAALAFALKVVDRRAQVDADDIAALKRAGFDDGTIVELLAHVALNLFTNYVNIALDVPVDFPAVPLREAA
ncbi:MAG TPA: carboxymuconolactone decarboxylase family protein [Mizugakiibacter sp.]